MIEYFLLSIFIKYIMRKISEKWVKRETLEFDRHAGNDHEIWFTLALLISVFTFDKVINSSVYTV